MALGLVEISSQGMSSFDASEHARWMSSSDQQMILDGLVWILLRWERSVRLSAFGLERMGA